MRKLIWVFLFIATLAGLFGGCCNPPSGSREYRPGQGWVPND